MYASDEGLCVDEDLHHNLVSPNALLITGDNNPVMYCVQLLEHDSPILTACYRLWLHGLHGPWCQEKGPLKLITDSLMIDNP